MIRFVAAVLAVVAASTTAYAQNAYALYTRWGQTDDSSEDCLQHAQEALRAASFAVIAVQDNNSVYGRRGAYTACVRCISDKGIAFFVNSGPTTNLTSQYLTNIYNNFEGIQ